MMYLGDYLAGTTVDFMWSTNGADGASITRATNGTVSVYKGNSTTQTTTGVTDTEDFDSLTGIHHCRVATSDAFYAAGNDFMVVLSGATIDGKTVNSVLAMFSIENRNTKANVTHWLGTAAATPTVAGVPEVDVTHWLGTAAATPTVAGVPEVDVTHWQGTAAAAVDTAGYPKVTLKSGTGTGEVSLSGGRANANVTYWNSAAVATPDAAGYPKVTLKTGTGTGELSITTGSVGANVEKVAGSAAAATNMGKAYQIILPGTFVTGTLAAGSATTDLTGYGDDTFNGRVLTIISGARAGEQVIISDYTSATGLMTFSTVLTGAPANADEFFIA